MFIFIDLPYGTHVLLFKYVKNTFLNYVNKQSLLLVYSTSTIIFYFVIKSIMYLYDFYYIYNPVYV